MNSVPNNYEINIVKNCKYWGRVEILDDDEQTAKEKLEFLRELFGNKYHVYMTQSVVKEKEIRPCAICGRDITRTGGMTDGVGWYCHEGKCFHKYMNKTYGKHKWMVLGNEEEDGYGGYYIHTSDTAGGYEGTGIFYTEWA